MFNKECIVGENNFNVALLLSAHISFLVNPKKRSKYHFYYTAEDDINF
jgi:poly(3-hydroxyalkanoate) synthetase